jgi:glutathione S-transferase
MLTLYQAEWCPYSSAVRELLTEAGIPFVARPVEPWPDDRVALRDAAGVDQIPTLVTEDGAVHTGTRAIFGWVATQPVWEHAEAQRERFREHRETRMTDAVGQLVERVPR